MKRVSVIIPCYNYGQFVEETVQSAFESTYPNIEVIVVDDGSTDSHTIDVLSAMASKFPQCIIHHQTNMGLPGARNSGIRLATGEYILPLDADDLIDATFIEKAVWVLERNPNVGMVYSFARIFGSLNYTWYTKKFNLNQLYIDNYIPATAVFPKRVWEELGCYDETFIHGYEDWEFWLRIATSGYVGYRIGEELFHYRKHTNSMLAGSNQKHFELVRQIRERYKPKIQRLGLGTGFFGALRGREAIRGMYKQARRFIPSKIELKLKTYYHSVLSRSHTVQQLSGDAGAVLSEYRFTPSPSFTRAHSVSKGKCVILYILPWLKVGGVETVYNELLKNLDKSRFYPIIMLTRQAENVLVEEFRKITPHIYNLPAMSDETADQMSFMLDILCAYDVSVVQICNSKLGYQATPYIKKYFTDVRVIDHLHMEQPEQPWDYFRFSRPFDQYIDKRIVITESLKQAMISKYQVMQDKIEVVPNGIDSSWFNSRPRSVSHGITVGFVGRLEEQKDPMFFLRLCQHINEKGIIRDVAFVMVGDGPLRRSVVRELRKSSYLKNVTLLGERRDVRDLLWNHIDILVLPSVREGLPMIGLEAMASRVVVVASRVPGWTDLIEHEEDGFLVESKDVNEYTDSLSRVVNDIVLKNRIVENACYKVKLFYTTQRMTNEFADLYEIIKK